MCFDVCGVVVECSLLFYDSEVCVCASDLCLICEAWSFKCVCSGGMLVSPCRCLVLVSSVHPVAMRSAVFCIVCSVVCAIDDHIVEAYSSIVLIA